MPDNRGYTGFQGAPVSKFILGTAISSSFALNFPLKHHKPYFIYTHTDIFDKYQIWRMFTAKLAFLELKDLFIYSVLIYYFKIFEKRYGSRKFCSCLLGSGFLASLLELLTVYVCRIWQLPLNPLPSGPLCFIYPLFVPFYCDIPRVPISHLWGIPMTGKSISYILGLQVASSSPESILVAVCGLMAGVLWRINFLKVQTLFTISKWVEKAFSVTLGQLLDNTPAIQQNTTHIGATLELQQQESTERLEQHMLWDSFQNSRNNDRPQPQNLTNGPDIFGIVNNNLADDIRNGHHNVEPDEVPYEVSEDQVNMLVEMGFDQQQVREALEQSENNVSVATNLLLQQT